ncbi:carboxypeptidase B-like [Schistocerca serialis cubense]|uniref:carboxypeptidase B-like n=1 Tax=Schistocerca serialis cubense TaxID=2023355 RepID=UPI00214E64FC|nr:carboxypeptidase B-like [Schistocerca serialis cubense]
MRASALCLLPLLALLAPALAAVSYRGHEVYRLVPTEEQLPVLAEWRQRADIDFWSQVHLAGHPVDVRVPPHLQREFREHLYRHRVEHQLLINDLEQVFEMERQWAQTRAVSRNPESRISFTEYLRYDEILQYLLDLASNYSDTVTVESIGNSYAGRDLDIIKISSGGDDTRPVILIDAGIHAREWIAPAAALYVINQLVENPAESALTDNVDWHIVPVLNPDGYEYTFKEDRMWRKTRSTEITGCVGVDGNRNFNFHWNETGSSNDPCSDTYAGPMDFSEVETSYLRNHINRNIDRIKLYLTFHSYGPYMLYPWGYTSELPDDWETLDALGQEAIEAQQAAGGPNYTIGSIYNVMYAASGVSNDWVKGVAGVNLSFTLELPGGGDTGFDPPASDILSIVTPFFEAIRVFGQYVADNYG